MLITLDLHWLSLGSDTKMAQIQMDWYPAMRVPNLFTSIIQRMNTREWRSKFMVIFMLVIVENLSPRTSLSTDG